jgi:thiamine biosynthesis lipoprotein
MTNKRGFWACVIFLIGALFFFVKNQTAKEEAPFQRDEGTIFGTIYHITYRSSDNLQQEILGELRKFDASLSMFNTESVITRVNRGDSTVVLDPWFIHVFEKGREVSRATGGAFDMTVAPLVNAWGFGFKKSDSVTDAMIDSIREFVGYDKVQLVDGRIVKSDPRLMLDASAIAKGYACDVVAQFLASRGIKDYMVEIGGEVMTEGYNPSGKEWRIGINKPIEDASASTGEIEAVVKLHDQGMATSGNYRNFYYKDGKRFAHTIDPKTGYPVEHTLLSATVIAKDCMTADAYATAFMVMGLERSIALADSIPGLDAFFIYSDSLQQDAVMMTKGFGEYIVK